MKVQFWYIYMVMVEEVIIKWFQNDLVLNKEVDVEVSQEVDKEVANVVNKQVVQMFWLFMGKVLTNTDVVQKCSVVEDLEWGTYIGTLEMIDKM